MRGVAWLSDKAIKAAFRHADDGGEAVTKTTARA